MLLTDLTSSKEMQHRGDSNPCGQSPMDFESISLTARTQCHNVMKKNKKDASGKQGNNDSMVTWVSGLCAAPALCGTLGKEGAARKEAGTAQVGHWQLAQTAKWQGGDDQTSVENEMCKHEKQKGERRATTTARETTPSSSNISDNKEQRRRQRRKASGRLT